MTRSAAMIRATTMIAMMIHRGSMPPGPVDELDPVVKLVVDAVANGRPGRQASFAAVATVRVYTVFGANAACPTVRTVSPEDHANVSPATAGLNEIAPSVAVLFIASLKVMTTAAFVATPVALPAGCVDAIVGAVESIFTPATVEVALRPPVSMTVRTMPTFVLSIGVVHDVDAGDERPVRSCTLAIGFTVAATV
jgi:hypothetical protein